MWNRIRASILIKWFFTKRSTDWSYFFESYFQAHWSAPLYGIYWISSIPSLVSFLDALYDVRCDVTVAPQICANLQKQTKKLLETPLLSSITGSIGNETLKCWTYALLVNTWLRLNHWACEIRWIELFSIISEYQVSNPWKYMNSGKSTINKWTLPDETVLG